MIQPQPVASATAADTTAALSEGVIIPSCTIGLWFDPENFENHVTDLEKESLPEFFNERYPSKTPTVYKEYRNFMIALYRMNPSVYLSATTVRRHLAGDVNAIIRVHAFLEKWGLINFQVHPRYKPQKLSLLKESSYDKVLINAANKNSLAKHANEYRGNLHLKQEEGQADVKTDQNLLQLINIATVAARPLCHFSESKVGFQWYELPAKNLVLSEAAFKKGHFPSGFKKDEFVQRTLPAETWNEIRECFSQKNLAEAEQLRKGRLAPQQQKELVMIVAELGI